MKNSIIQRVVDASERLLFGATAQEAVQRRLALIDQRVDAAFARMLAGLDQDDDKDEDGAQTADDGSAG